jgi:hypothetical protein
LVIFDDKTIGISERFEHRLGLGCETCLEIGRGLRLLTKKVEFFPHFSVICFAAHVTSPRLIVKW